MPLAPSEIQRACFVFLVLQTWNRGRPSTLVAQAPSSSVEITNWKLGCRVVSMGLLAGLTNTGGESVFASAGITFPSLRSKKRKGVKPRSSHFSQTDVR